MPKVWKKAKKANLKMPSIKKGGHTHYPVPESIKESKRKIGCRDFKGAAFVFACMSGPGVGIGH
jgi:hypothetical protein